MTLWRVEPVLDSVGPRAEPTIHPLPNDGRGGPMNDRRPVNIGHNPALLNSVQKSGEPGFVTPINGAGGERWALERTRRHRSRRFIGPGELLDRPGSVLYVGGASKRGLQLAHYCAEAGVRCFARIVWQHYRVRVSRWHVRGKCRLVLQLSMA